MNVGFIQEPLLEFGAGKHVDIRFGLMNHGPLDLRNETAPQRVRLGIVGTPEGLEGIHAWVERIGRGVAAKESRQPNLFPRFPGFGEGINLLAPLFVDSRLHGAVKQRELDSLFKSSDRNRVVEEAVVMFLSEMRRLTEKASVDVLVCAVPEDLIDYMEEDHPPMEDAEVEHSAAAVNLDFHNLLKARAMDLGVPIQLLLPSTYDASKHRRQKRRSERIRSLQDEATRAWNIYIALYYKAGEFPGGSFVTLAISPPATLASASTAPWTERNSSRVPLRSSTSAATGSSSAGARRRGPRRTGRYTCPARTPTSCSTAP